MVDDKPCSAAEALRRIRQVEINGIKTGIVMLDDSIAEVRAQNLGSEAEIRAALLKKIRISNYVPRAAEDAYVRALMGEYKKIHHETLIQKNLNIPRRIHDENRSPRHRLCEV